MSAATVTHIPRPIPTTTIVEAEPFRNAPTWMVLWLGFRTGPTFVHRKDAESRARYLEGRPSYEREGWIARNVALAQQAVR